MDPKAIKLIASEQLLLELSDMESASSGAYSLFLLEVGYTGNVFARLGNQAADMLLLRISDILGKFCRNSDRVFRIGEKTFAVMLAGIRDAAHAQLAAEKLGRLQREQGNGEIAKIEIDMRIGIANYFAHATDPQGILHQARVALEAAISSRSNYEIYCPETEQSMASHWEMQEELRQVIEEGGLALHYQPKIDIASGKLIGAEALMRWTSQKFGEVSPEIFIPMVMELGLMDKLAWFLVNTALRQAAEWPDESGPMSISVNLESDIVQGSDIVDLVKSAVSIWGNARHPLILEITERALMADSESNFEVLNQLRGLGVGISIDDFGTGYSSLSYFKDIPATELKVDKSFVTNMCSSDKDKHIVETIVWLAHRFELTVVAEGVEDGATLTMLSELGCDFAQGYLISKPLAHKDFVDWLSQQQSQ